MLRLQTPIGHGGTRSCWRHPNDPALCVKILNPGLDRRELLREARVCERVSPLLPGRVAHVEPKLADTDRGPGLICRLIRNADGTLAPNIREYISAGGDTARLQNGLDWLVRRIIARNLFFFDFNFGNFAVQTRADGSLRIWLIDVKSLNRAGFDGYLKLDRVIAPLARTVMFRRLRRLYRELGLKFPFDRLCKAVYFSTWLVSVRP